ncbi:FAD-binding oxidoreductase [bacterium]|nr:MAG: FAD-binding oxidoreductase [bacterium]
MKNASFWETDSFLSKPYDLIVIGSGIVGLSSAYFTKLKHPEKRILIVERGFLPSGASTKNAGFACFGSPTELLSDLKNESEDEVIQRIKWRWNGLKLLRKTLGDSTIQFDACGSYELFNSEREMRDSIDNLEYLNELMEESTGEKEMFSYKPINGKEAIYSRLEGSIHTGEMMKAWIQKNQELGNEIRFNTTVETIEFGFVELENGIELRAKHILVATNGFAERLTSKKVRPARGLVMISEPFANMPWKGTFHYDEGFVYFRNVGNRLLLGGGRNQAFTAEETSEFGTNQRIKSYLLNLADDFLQIDLRNNLAQTWSGIMGFSETKSPIIEDNEGISIRVALGGMGVAIGSDIGFSFAESIFC